MATKNLYVICGPAGAGKTTLVAGLKWYGYNTHVSYTTRPRRDGDLEGSYHFVTEEEFFNLPDLVEHTEYAGNYFGSTKSSLDEADIAIMDPAGVAAIRAAYTSRPVYVIGVNVPTSTLRKRLSYRPNADELITFDAERYANIIDFCDEVFHSNVAKDQLLSTVIHYINVHEWSSFDYKA